MAPLSSILVVDSDTGFRQSIRVGLEADGVRVVGAGTRAAALDALGRGAFDAVILSLWLGDGFGAEVLWASARRRPRLPVIVVTANACCEEAVFALKQGAADYLQKPLEPEDVREAIERAIDEHAGERPPSPGGLLDPLDAGGLSGSASPAYRKVLADADRVAPSACPVLLRGESGTGKTVLARWIHDRSPRAGGPFVTVNCPQLGELMSSTLFGHKRGAFTGAVADATGKVQEAQRGTLFLDEVGDLLPDAQARLLRFLNDQTFERVGESREHHADVRIVAATNRDLEQDVRAGRFREDLFYRLAVVRLTLPPLRERRLDVLPLALGYLRAEAPGRPLLSFSAAALERIQTYPWPGNMRELHNAVKRAAAMARGDVIEVEDLGLDDDPAGSKAGAVVLGGDVTIAALEREHIARVLVWATRQELAAEVLGISLATLKRKRKLYGLV